MAKGKQPVARFKPERGKHPITAVDPAEAARRENVSWRFSIADFDGGSWGWHELATVKAKEIYGKLCGHETMTLAELFTKKGTNKIAVERICKEAQDRLTALKLDDIDELFELRLSGKERVWGTITGSIFNLLWWDPEHTVYPVAKKHT